MNYWGKLICVEGVEKQRGFTTLAEARAYIQGLSDGIDAADPESDFYSTAVDTQPAKEE